MHKIYHVFWAFNGAGISQSPTVRNRLMPRGDSWQMPPTERGPFQPRFLREVFHKAKFACAKLDTNILLLPSQREVAIGAVQSACSIALCRNARPMSEARKKRSLAGVTLLSHQRAAAPRAATLVYNALRDDIISLRRKPMDLLNEKDLEAQFGVSRTPIREAILRLSDDGLVDIFPQSGTFISRIPCRALYEAILVRKALEDTTVSIAVEKMTPAGLRLLDRNLADLSACLRDGDVAAFLVLDSDFHKQISDIAGFPGIWAIIQQVKVHSDRYRLLTLMQEGRLARVIEEHSAVIDCMRAGDKKGAAEAMGFHLGSLLHEVEKTELWDPNYFIEDAKASFASVGEKERTL